MYPVAMNAVMLTPCSSGPCMYRHIIPTRLANSSGSAIIQRKPIFSRPNRVTSSRIIKALITRRWMRQPDASLDTVIPLVRARECRPPASSQ